MSLRNKVLSGIKWTSTSTLIIASLQFIQLYVVAKLIGPEAFGLMATLMIVIGFAQIFMDFGISNAIIQRQVTSTSELSSLYWVNIFFGFFMCLLVAILSPLVSNFYDSPSLLYPTILASLYFLIQSFGSQYKVLFEKDLEFNLIAKVEMISVLIGTTVTVVLAYIQFGVYALVLGMLSNVFVSSLLFVLYGLELKHKPSMTFSFNLVRPYLSFGMYQVGEKSVNYLSSNVDRVLVAKFLGLEAAGFYDMAWKLIMYPSRVINPVINKVAFPLYSKIKTDTQLLHKYYFIVIKALTILTIPILIFLSFNADKFVPIFLGERWSQVAVVIKILSFVGLIRAMGNPGGILLLSLGFVKVGFWWNVFWASMVSIVLYATVIFFPSLENISLALLLNIITVGSIWHVLIAKYSKVEYKKILLHFFRFILFTLSLAMLIDILVEKYTLHNNYLDFFISLFIYISAYSIFALASEPNLFKSLKKE